MPEYRQIYKVLKILKASLGAEEFDSSLISYEKLGFSKARWSWLMAILLKKDFITGVEVYKTADSKHPRVRLVKPEITQKGLKHLAEDKVLQIIQSNEARGIFLYQ